MHYFFHIFVHLDVTNNKQFIFSSLQLNIVTEVLQIGGLMKLNNYIYLLNTGKTLQVKETDL